MRNTGTTLAALVLVLTATGGASALDNAVTVTVEGDRRCIASNGLPDHDTGQFPNRGNPHRISEQNVRLCVPLNPQKGETSSRHRGSVGVAINGVQFRPGTADYYDASSPRGHSRDPRSGWNLEGLGAREMLGMDANNAHVDARGLYHYHGVPETLVDAAPDSLLGWAADGFEIHYLGAQQRASWQLKSGTRPSSPGGRYDGTYEEDWEFVARSGTLDRCNGGMLDGRFVYFATDTFPFFPRCFWGAVSPDFQQRGPQGGPQGRPLDRGPREGRRGEGFHPGRPPPHHR